MSSVPKKADKLNLSLLVSLSAGIQSTEDSVPKTLVQILHSAEEDNLFTFRFKNCLPVPEHQN